MRTPLLLLTLILCPFVHAALPADTTTTIAGLGGVHREHPYLLFSAADKPAMLARIRATPREAEAYEALLLEGRRLLYASVERDTVPAREIHARFVGNNDYQRFVGQHLEAAFNLAFLYQMTGEAPYAAKAFEHAEIICALDTWVQGAHTFPVIYQRVWPAGARDDQVVFTYDITTSGTSQRLALIYDWLYAALAKPQRDRLRSALLEKGITRVRGNYEYFWWATAYRCNWSGICHSGLGLAALALLNEDPQLVDVIARSTEGVSAMLDHVGPDGGWQEGRGYWAYGVGESVRFIEALRRASAGKIDLFRHRSLAQHPLDFALYGLTAGFCDGSGAPVGETAMVNKLVQESGDATAAWYAQHFVRSRHDVFAFIWPTPAITPQAPTDGSRFFPSIDWAVLRKDFAASSVTVATKAGMNDDPHHGHLDCGTFTLTWQNQSFVGEVPRSSYDETYFSALRWGYLEARTNGHNCILVNGEEQICAKEKDQPWKDGIGGHVTTFANEKDWSAVAMDPTHAYPGRELKGWKRWIILEKETNVVLVVDQVQCAAGAQIEARFHPGVEATVAADRVTLSARSRMGAEAPTERRRAQATAAREAPREPVTQLPTTPSGRAELEMLSVGTGAVTIVEGRQPDLPVQEEPQLAWVPYFSTVMTASAERNALVAVFYPANLRSADAVPTARIEWAGDQPRVVCTLRGKTTAYTLGAEHINRAAP